MENELKAYELKVAYNNDEDREPIDLMLLDANNDETYATLFGSEPFNDYDWTCDHPSHLIEYDDDETVGTCPICGATCDWHWAKDFDGDTNITYREPHEWYHPKEPKGIIGHILENIRKDF